MYKRQDRAPFPDVEGHRYKEWITQAVYREWMPGYVHTNEFAPDEGMTAEEIAEVMGRVLPPGVTRGGASGVHLPRTQVPGGGATGPAGANRLHHHDDNHTACDHHDVDAACGPHTDGPSGEDADDNHDDNHYDHDYGSPG